MANTEENETPGDVEIGNMADTEASGDVEVGNGESPAPVQPAPPNILEQARLGNLDLFRTELQSGTHPLNFKAGRAVYFNRTPLHLAAMEGHIEIVEFVLSRPEISREVVNAKDDFGYTPLHLAVRQSHEEVVRLLATSSLVLPDRFLAATSESDDVGAYCGGCTPLHLAAVGGHTAIAKLLLRQPCQVEFAYDTVNIFAMTWRNSTPLELARQNKFWDLGDFLEASDLNYLQHETTRTSTSANAVLVGAALVAAAAFAAWLQPPGGVPNPDSGAPSPSPSTSSSSASSDPVYGPAFYVSIAFAFFASLSSVQYGMLATFRNPGVSLGIELAELRSTLWLAQRCLEVGIFFFCFAFGSASSIVLGNIWLAMIVLLLPSFVLVSYIYAVRKRTTV